MSEAGKRIGPYELLEPLGRGGMGVVWRAVHAQSGQAVALKSVTGPREGLLSGLRREIHALARLRHPGIVRVLDEGTHEGTPWYAMELLQGTTLRAWSRQAVPAQDGASAASTASSGWWTQSLAPGGGQRVGPPTHEGEPGAPAGGPGGELAGSGPAAGARTAASSTRLSEVLSLTRRLCAPLAYLHGEGLVHRDLKPENILLRDEPGTRNNLVGAGLALPLEGEASLALTFAGLRPVLVDFGLATQFAGLLGREALSVEAGAAGTVVYIAPEQARGQAVDARADLYALGCVLYELLTGRPPFVGATPMEVLLQHLEARPRPPSSVAEGLGPELDALVLRLLAKEPRSRFGHADDVAAALGALGAGNGTGEGTPRVRAYLYRPGFAGREEVMGRLRWKLERLQGGAGGLVLVGGESGVGKTRLAQELSREAARREVLVLAGECVPGAGGSEPQEGGSAAQEVSPSDVSRLSSVRVARGRSRRSPAGRGKPAAGRQGVAAAPLPAGGGGALQALRKPLQAIADRCRALGAAETERLLGRRGKVLALYEESLEGLPGQEAYPEPVELPAEAARLRLYSYLSETFEALAGQAEVLLLLDDLQWADELMLGWLRQWLRFQAARSEPGAAGEARTGAAAPVLVVGTYRTEEAGAALRGLLEARETEGLRLERLEEAAVAAMVGDMLALEPAPRLFSSFLARQSEGNPFFVAEYLRAMLEPVADGHRPLLWRDAGGSWQVAEPEKPEAARGGQEARPASLLDYEALPLPRTLRELVARRLEGLPEAARHVIEAAAVLGREQELEVLRRMVGLSEELLLDALHELQQRHVLEELPPVRAAPWAFDAGPRPASLRFVHEKIREVAAERIPDAGRPGLHRAAAESIETVLAAELPEHQAELGRHWEAAGEAARARDCYLPAARQATERYRHEEAERLYRAYLRLVEETTKESIAARNELGQKVLALRGATDEAVAEHQKALEQTRVLGQRALEGETLTMLGTVYWMTGRMEQARAFFEQALTIYREVGDRTFEASVLGFLALLHAEQGRMEQARQGYEQALAIHGEVGNRQGEGVVLGNLANLHLHLGQMEQAQQLYEQALAIHREVGDQQEEGRVLGNLAVLHNWQGRTDQARQLYEQALASHREVGDLRFESQVLGNLAILHAGQGRIEQSRQAFEQALAIGREVGDRKCEGIVLGNLAGLHEAQGQMEQSRQLCEQALAIHREVGNRRYEGYVLDNLALLHTEQGGMEQARRLHEQALAIHREIGDRMGEGMVLGNLASLELLTRGDSRQAAELAEQGERVLTSLGNKLQMAKLLCCQGHISLAAGPRAGGQVEALARSLLERAEALASGVQARSGSPLGNELSKLRRAVAAFEAGEHHRLHQGMLIDDLSEGLRRWLREAGRLSG